MSLLNELKKRKEKLKEVETIITRADGIKYVERTGAVVEKTYGFVVDTKPDDVPILIVPHLYIGSQDCTIKNVIDKNNIQHVLSLGIHVDCEVNYKYVSILDLPESDVKPILIECLPFIRNCIENKQNVLVHCNAGVSRTAMVTIAYLMHYERFNFDEAYKFIKAKRPAIQPNAGFRKQLECMKPGGLI